MKTSARWWATVAVVVATVASARPAVAQTATISVDIRDYAGNSPSVLRDVHANLAQILERAGVTTVSAGAPRYTVNIVSAEMARVLDKNDEWMGFVPVGAGGRIVYVLDARIEGLSAMYRVDKAAVLAAVIAHELGHLILPPHAHSAYGVMRPDWNETDFRVVDQGAMQFPRSQAKQLCKSLTAH